jgi:hypothetical protein
MSIRKRRGHIAILALAMASFTPGCSPSESANERVDMAPMTESVDAARPDETQQDATAAEQSDAAAADAAGACLLGIDALLAEVGAPTDERTDCGSFNDLDRENIVEGLECFNTAILARKAAQLTVNRCIDCSIPSTFVTTADSRLFRIEVEQDHFGDKIRHVVVESCQSVGGHTHGDVACDGAMTLYQCAEPFDAGW